MNTPQQAKKAQEINCNTLQLNRIVKFLLIPIVFVLFSCVREIDIDSVNVEQELVVSAVIHPDQIDSLLLSSTYNTVGITNIYGDDKPDIGIPGATISVITKGDTIGKYVEKNKGSYYYEGENFQEKQEYRLNIQHPDYPTVSANTTMPITPEFRFTINHINGKKETVITGADLQVSLVFEDSADTNDFYMISATSTSEIIIRDYFNPEVIDTIIIQTNLARINSRSSVIEMIYHGTSYNFAQNDIDWESYYHVSEDELIFSDKLFNGEKVTIPVDLSLFELRNTICIHLSLTAISEEYFQLLRSLAAYRKSERGIFPEALQVYSNVNNGQGIWAAKSSKTITLDISELELFNYE
jgi:hypothetical protein